MYYSRRYILLFFEGFHVQVRIKMYTYQVALAACVSDGEILRYVSEELRDCKEFVSETVTPMCILVETIWIRPSR